MSLRAPVYPSQRRKACPCFGRLPACPPVLTLVLRHCVLVSLVSWLLVSGGLASCSHPDFLIEERYEQIGYTNEVDLLFVIDNSGSMREEQDALATNFDRLIQDISSAAQQERAFPHTTLRDAVSNYLFFVNNFGRFIRFRIATTTTQVDEAALENADPGVSGRFIPPFPDDSAAPLYLQRDDDDPVAAFGDVVDYVQGHSQAVGEERGLEAARLALCRSHPTPELLLRESNPVSCEDVVFSDTVGSNGSYLREDVPLAVVVFTDEGDSSPNAITDYLEFFETLDRPFSISAVAPTLPRDENDSVEICNPEGAPATQLERYREAVESTRGLLIPICRDFAETLEDLSQLINNLLMRFRLRRIPQVDSILVFVDGNEVVRDDENGWIYDAGRNSIAFTGTAIPDYNATIEVYYRSLVATDPRTLPF